MCGIAGIWDATGASILEGNVRRMGDSLSHRGPDATSVWVGSHVGFAHTRLSIIDLTSGGSQPFISADGRYVLVFNGELYNYRELSSTHLPDVQFQSTSDTEVLLHMLIRYGAPCLPDLRGMFAFAFFDTKEGKLLFACDPFGKKPLYYAWREKTLVFASEPKALFASGRIAASLDSSVTPTYLLHEYIPKPQTGFQGVHMLSGGHVMEVSPNGVRIDRYYTPTPEPKAHISFSAAAKKFDELLGAAVERRLVADVPVGIFLSGGLDSSTIAWYMRNIRPTQEFTSCSISFEDTSFHEGQYAKTVADSLGLNHRDELFTYESFRANLRELIPKLDIPFADASVVPTYAVSKLARKNMKVVLDGDGSDELLGGYGTFDAYTLHRTLSFVPGFIWRALLMGAEAALPVSHSYFSLDFKLKSFLRGAAYSDLRAIQVWLGAFDEHEIRNLLRKPSHAISQLFDGVDFSVDSSIRGPFDRASLYHIRSYLENDILVKIDRATMATGLEARTPFLDTDLADFILTLPPEYKQKKKIVKHVMRGRLPEHIIDRKKQGFGIPLSSWLMKDNGAFVKSILSRDRIERDAIFSFPSIEMLIDQHLAKKHDHRKKLWTLIMFQLWHEYWILGNRDIVEDV